MCYVWGKPFTERGVIWMTVSLADKFLKVVDELRSLNPEVYYLETWDMPGEDNMRIDLGLLKSQHSVFRLYTWRKPTLSFGRLQPDRERERLRERAKRLGVDVVTRPTGGRAVLHYKELTYSFAGNLGRLTVLDIHLIFNYIFREAIANLGCNLNLETSYKVPKTPNCFQLRATYELGYGQDKVMGSAIRLLEGRFLIHGSLLLERDPLWEKLFGGVKGYIGLFEACPKLREEGLEGLKRALLSYMEKVGISLKPATLEALNV